MNCFPICRSFNTATFVSIVLVTPVLAQKKSLTLPQKKPLPLAQKKSLPLPQKKPLPQTKPLPQKESLTLPEEKPLPLPEQKPLTLADVLRDVEETHPKLRGAEAERQSATAKRISKQGAFDLNIVAGTDFQRYNSTSTRGKVANASTTDAGAELTLRNGVKLYAGARLNSGAVKAPDSQTGTGGEYVAYAAVPLLRGLGINPKSAGERQAILGEPLANEQFRRTRLDTLAQAGFAYWDFVAAGQRLSVARELLSVASTRATATQKRADLGDLPRVDALEARQEVERRRGALTKAERDLQKAAFKLAQYRFAPDGSPLPVPGEEAVPREASLPKPKTVAADEQEEVRQNAIAARPELPAIELQQRIVRVERDLAKNDQKPSLDFIFSPGADTGSRAIGGTLKTGLAFTFPLERRDASGRVSEANLKLAKLEQEALLLQTQIRLEVDDAVSAVNLGVQRYDAAVRELDLARQVESRERERLRLGEGTLFLLNQRERATAEAAGRVIDMRAEYFQALLSLQVASAQL